MRQKTRLLSVLFAAVISFCSPARAADARIDYRDPEMLTGTVYADASLTRVLFTFRRTATEYGSTIRATREFNLPDGTLAARERMVYERGQLRSYSLEEHQIGARGIATLQPGAREEKMNIDYAVGTTRRNGSEKVQEETLVGDMVGPYIDAHWHALVGGAVLKCRIISVMRAETIGFKFFKESETTWHNKPVVIVKAEPTSILIAQLVAPLHFVVEKADGHRVLEYSGRTTPKFRKNGKWEDLDAVTVMDWN